MSSDLATTANPNDGSFLDGIISAYGSEDDTFTITLPKGETLKFRAIRDYAELQRLKRGARQFCMLFDKGKTHPEWAPYLTSDKETQALVYCLAETVLEPKLLQKDFLRLAKEAAFLFEHIRKAVDEAQSAYANADEHEEIEQAKNESGATELGETG